MSLFSTIFCVNVCNMTSCGESNYKSIKSMMTMVYSFYFKRRTIRFWNTWNIVSIYHFSKWSFFNPFVQSLKSWQHQSVPHIIQMPILFECICDRPACNKYFCIFPFCRIGTYNSTQYVLDASGDILRIIALRICESLRDVFAQQNLTFVFVAD